MFSEANTVILITIGCTTMFSPVIALIFLTASYQRKMYLKQNELKIFEQEKQIALFKASADAELKERERISRNLHDEINPLLNLLKQNLERHQLYIAANKFNSNELKIDHEILDKAVESIRTISENLIPSFLIRFGLTKSLQDHFKILNRDNTITFEIQVPENTEYENNISTNDQLHIYRICLEILNNLCKHAHSNRILLKIDNNDRLLNFDFTHNGKGIDNTEANTQSEYGKGKGLSSIKARVLILKAVINFHKKINGSTIKLQIPISYGKDYHHSNN